MPGESSAGSKTSTIAHGAVMVAKDPPLAGFTAVNGDSQKHHLDSLNRSQSWRPQDPHPNFAEAVSLEHNSLKRKRSDVAAERPRSPLWRPGRDAQTPDGRLSVAATAPEDEGAEKSTDREERIASPPRQWNKGDVPQQAQLETQKALAEQLASALSRNGKSLAPEPHATSPRGGLPPQPASSDAGRDRDREGCDSQHESPEDESGDEEDQGDGDQANGDTGNSESAKQRKRQFSKRTKTGCVTCRKRKKKCDEAKPTCKNCERGGFTCGGYGPKPAGYKLPTASGPRPAVTLQSKEHHSYPPMPPHHHGQSHPGPPSLPLPPESHGYMHPHARHAPPPPAHDPYPHYHMDGRPPPPPPPPPSDPYGKQSWYHPGPSYPPPPPSEPLRHHYPQDRIHSRDHSSIPPYHGHQPDPYLPLPPPPPPPPPSHTLPPLAHPGPILPEPYHFRPSNGAYTNPANSHTGSGGSSHHSSRFFGHPGNPLTEREKMLHGKPFAPGVDADLILDRKECQAAVQAYNDALRPMWRPDPNVTAEQAGVLFGAIIKPRERISEQRYGPRRPFPGHPIPTTLRGHVGNHTTIDSGFNCDYGYNIHLGNNISIGRNCEMEDSCKITVGDRTIIGTGVKFTTSTMTVLENERGDGFNPRFIGGAIAVGEGCFIGNNVQILPYRKIGNGAVVGAGSVVTKDVAANTVVAGNPAKYIRTIDQSATSEKRHAPIIQEQNERRQQEMIEDAKRDIEHHR